MRSKVWNLLATLSMYLHFPKVLDDMIIARADHWCEGEDREDPLF